MNRRSLANLSACTLVTAAISFSPLASKSDQTDVALRRSAFFSSPTLSGSSKLPTGLLRVTRATYAFEARRNLNEMQELVITPKTRRSMRIGDSVSLFRRSNTVNDGVFLSTSVQRIVDVRIIANGVLPGANVVRSRRFTFTFDEATGRLLSRAFALATPNEARLAGLRYIPPAISVQPRGAEHFL